MKKAGVEDSYVKVGEKMKGPRVAVSKVVWITDTSIFICQRVCLGNTPNFVA